MRRMYPKPHAIAQTIAHSGTSLQGSRRFYSAAGVVVYAYDRMGMANAARRTWLPPSATRRLSTYLDMITPAVAGLTMQPAGVQAAQLEVGGPTSAAGRLRELADAALGQPRGSSNQTLCCVDESPDPAWTWSGVLHYDHSYRLRTGEYSRSRPPVTFHVRSDPRCEMRTQILVEIRRQPDYRQVQRWIAELLPAHERWAVLPCAFLNGPERHAEILGVAKAIGAGGEIKVAHGYTQRSNAPAGADLRMGEFEQTMIEGHYKTAMHGVDAFIDRAENRDFAIITAFDLYYWRGTGTARAAMRVRVKQQGADPLTIEWGSVREPVTQGGVPLSSPVDLSKWEKMTPAEWPDDARMTHLRTVWSELLDVQSSSAAVAA
jgi:hypothetical protein